MHLIDADKAQPGTTIVAAFQQQGRGQRGNTWTARPGESLMMSLITEPGFAIDQQFLFSALVAATIAGCIQSLDGTMRVQVKWPNDIIINDKKVGGILIENVLRGHSWLYAVIGFGLNVLQEDFGRQLPNATSLRIATGKALEVQHLMQEVRGALIQQITTPPAADAILAAYNELLFRKGEAQLFFKEEAEWEATVLRALPNGQLEVRLEDGTITAYTHGEVQWRYR